MTKLTEAKEEFLAQLGAMVITVDGHQHPPQFPDPDGWTAVEAVPGLYIRPLPTSGVMDSDIFQTRGGQGTQVEKASIPQSAQHTLLVGAMLWWQDSTGAEPRRRTAGDTARLEPHEAHSYVMLEDCTSVLVVTPPL